MKCGNILLAAALLSGCTGRSARSGDVPDMIRQAYDSPSEQAQVSAFLATYRERAVAFQQAGNFFGESELLLRLRAQYAGSAAVQDMSGQLIGTYASFLGDHEQALRYFDAAEDAAPLDSTILASLHGQVAVDAVQALVRAADSVSVLFINEAHHVPAHRALTLALLEPLYERGFRYLAAETLAETDSLLQTRGYPTQATGFYTNEPVFGELVRTALRIGYRLVPYEAVGPDMTEDRETGQARKLYERIFRDDAQARVLVHAGYAHINEAGRLAGVPPMAVRFREITGIDPLTVDQTTLSERGDPAREPPLYPIVLQSYQPRRPILLSNEVGRFWSARPGVHDATVTHPRTVYEESRPSWLRVLGDRRYFALPADVCGTADRCIVQARHAAEDENAVPVDALLIGGDAPARPLLLPRGEYRLVSRDAEGVVLRNWSATVR